MEFNEQGLKDKHVTIKTIDGMMIECKVLDDSNLSYIEIQPFNLTIKEPFPLGRNEIYLLNVDED